MPESITWGAIGAGDVMERKSGPPLYKQANSRLGAVTRRDADKGRDYARRHGCRFVPTVTELVADPSIDAIYVASPEAFHLEHVLAAAAAGKPVLVEKEMGNSTAECDAMIVACKKAQVPLGVAYYRRCHPSIRAAQRLLAAGAIGTPQRLWMNDQFPIVHRLDLTFMLFGDIASITVTEEDLPPDSHADRGPVLRALHASGTRSSGNLKMRENHDVEQVVIDGSESRLVIHDLKAGRMSRTWGWKFETLDQPADPWAHWGIIGNFVDHLRSGTPLACTGEDGRKTTVIMDAVRKGAGATPVAIAY
ncbi:NADH-dependent dehydrogenase [Planctomycetota bacterium]|nr:NADH-dependent dehydrogenase [Planctomycetota bacterium]